MSYCDAKNVDFPVALRPVFPSIPFDVKLQLPGVKAHSFRGCCKVVLLPVCDDGWRVSALFFLFFLFFLSDLLSFWSRSGHISPLYGQGSGCFCDITSRAASRLGGPVCPAPPGSDYTSKTTIFCERDTACFSWCKTALCQCALASWIQDVPEASRGF